ncbi:mechanosensitive ion channel family protein [Pontimonas sp.]|nr:mechanosensitive ion channel family protein [Pontimonas sp.]
MAFFMEIWVSIGLSALATLSIALIVLFGVWLFVRIVGRRIQWLQPGYNAIRPRLRFFILTVALHFSFQVVDLSGERWWLITSPLFLVALILSAGFLLQAAVNFAVSQFIDKFESEDQSDAETRRMATQLRLIRRLANAIIGILALGFALFVFPQVQALGAGVLASAGVLSVVGALAAQAVLGNLFAGIQLAFSNAIRVGDVVVVEGEWGTIGEITLSYVVVHIWDERRLIVPSTHFTSNSFETWTRKSSQVMGTVYMDLDWRVPLDKVRKEFESFLQGNPLFDGRVSSVLVTDAVGGYVQVRFLISASDSSQQWDLRCEVREHMVTWIQKNHPHALPITRVSLDAPAASPAPKK